MARGSVKKQIHTIVRSPGSDAIFKPNKTEILDLKEMPPCPIIRRKVEIWSDLSIYL